MRLQIHHLLFESLLVAGCLVAYLAAVVVYRGQRVAQEVGDAVGIGYPQTDEGKDAQLGVEQFARFGIDAPLLDQQIVEVLDEVGE